MESSDNLRLIDRLVISPSDPDLKNITCDNCLDLILPIGGKKCEKCEMKFCHSCIEKNLVCKCPNISLISIDESIKDIIQYKIILCKNRKKGCDEELSYNNFDKHDEECWNIHKCQSCDQMKYGYEMYSHKIQCEKVSKKCNKCEYEAPYNKFSHECEYILLKKKFKDLSQNMQFSILKELSQIAINLNSLDTKKITTLKNIFTIKNYEIFDEKNQKEKSNFIPKANMNYILWVDDLIFDSDWENNQFIKMVEENEKNFHITFFKKDSTQSAWDFLNSEIGNSLVFKAKNKFRIITDMVRMNEEDPYLAGANLIKLIKKLSNDIQVLIFTSNAYRTSNILEENELLYNFVRVTNETQEVIEFIKFEK